MIGGATLGISACSRNLPVPAQNAQPSASASRPSPSSSIAFDELLELLEATPRESVLERVADEIRRGLGRDQLLAALFAAATRHVLTSQMFGKEQHVLLAIYPAQRAGQVIGWGPALWAVDYFKWAQQEVKSYHAAPMAELPASRLPPPGQAAAELARAMDGFEGDRAEAALVSMYRAGQREAMIAELFRYGSKDFRHIGHKVIHVANGLRALAFAGWQHGEVVVRSMAQTLALHYQVKGHDADSAWPRNLRAMERLRPDWQRGQGSDEASHEATLALLVGFRTASAEAICDQVIEQINRGVGPRAIWDAMLLSSAELMMNNPTGIEALHAVTASNAAYATFRASVSERDRRLVLLQNAARLAEFHRYVEWWAQRRKPAVRHAIALEKLEPEPYGGSPAEALAAIHGDIAASPERSLRAARGTLALLSEHPAELASFARRSLDWALAAAKDTHDLKLTMAALEDASHLSPNWRARFLAACSLRFHGSSATKTPLATRIEALLA